MPQNMKIEAGALNVRTHPHSDDTYRALLRAAFSAKVPIKIRGDRHGLLTSLNRISAKENVAQGVITTFLKLDVDGLWLNTDTLTEASTNELEQIEIPDNLKPNLVSFYFHFDFLRHEIVFEHYGAGNRLSHKSAQTFFHGLFNHPKLKAKFGDVKVTIVQSRGSVDRLFRSLGSLSLRSISRSRMLTFGMVDLKSLQRSISKRSAPVVCLLSTNQSEEWGYVETTT